MPDPLDVLAEVLGEPAARMRSPANADFRCPFTNNTCIKKSRTLGEPAPVCSLYRHVRNGSPREHTPVCTCPNRFFATDLVGDVVRECWVGNSPANPVPVHEIGMQKFGKVDLVIADMQRNGTVGQFVPVELQAVDITGSVLPYYEAHISSRNLPSAHPYNFNWANVRKRFISQLIAKGFYCHHWGTRIVAIVQEDLYDQFQSHARLAEVRLQDSNIVFMLYQFSRNGERWEFGLQRVVPTTHTAVMNAILYEQPPSKALFERKILRRLRGL